jgi:hypothetical protein
MLDVLSGILMILAVDACIVFAVCCLVIAVAMFGSEKD